MTLNSQEVRKHVMDYLEATECSIIEVSPIHVTVKLSPRADRMLTDRPYYWGFVERTGVDPETLSFTFVFDPEKYDSQAALEVPPTVNRSIGALNPPITGNPAMGATTDAEASADLLNPTSPESNVVHVPSSNPEDSILARYFGIVPALPRIGPGMIRREDIIYGSKRLQQIWSAAQDEGKCLYLFEDPGSRQRNTLFSAAYEPWLGVCYKVEMSCDLKREELHYLGISLTKGTIIDDFNAKIASREMIPRLPENVHIQPYELTVTAATDLLEAHLTSHLAELDYTWAEQARERLRIELAIIDIYYGELLKEPDEEKRLGTQEQYNRRRQETIWQYEPQIAVSAITYGLFHLRSL
ncbi:YqhG family protein [Paenibacillus sp. FSL P4-0184]|uniref:YqhG family protein n=1 Tax=Paenibacillus sp. FSL P4-0184 TaxID=2921632 RepID=UPI0030F772C8